jgi:tetratricopeptide (TPR) repeat protein
MPPQLQSFSAAIPAERSASDALAEAIQRHHSGCYAEAEQLYRIVLAAEPRNPDALHGLGLLATQAGRLSDAIHLFQTAIQLDSLQAIYYLNLGNALQLQGQLGSATVAYQQSLCLAHDSGSAHSNLGMALLALGRCDEAVEHLHNAAELQPASSQIQDNLGNALQSIGRLEEAVSRHRRALQLSPGSASQVPEILGNLGLAFAGLGQWEQAMESFESALHRNPQNARIQLARAQLQLLLGEFESGLRNYEWRKQLQGPRGMPGKLWHGESIHPGETLILYAEQGLGDTIQALRYLPWVQARIPPSANLVLEVQRPILHLGEVLSATSKWLPFGAPIPPGNWHCSWMSLPLIFMESSGICDRQTPPASATFAVPYLFAPRLIQPPVNPSTQPRRKAKPALDSAWNIGIVWSGNKAHVRNRFRSIAPDLLKPLLSLKGCCFHSLQLEKLPSEFAGNVTDHSDVQTDLADTAELIQDLDLVISVDTAIAHLAGALAAPVWVLLPFWPDWRWGLHRQDSPWYPTMRLFRQQRPGEWEDVVERVRCALLDLTQEAEHAS